MEDASRPQCPACRVSLTAAEEGATGLQVCPRCGGAWITFDAVRQAIRQDIEARLTSEVRASSVEGKQNCPGCGRAMTQATVPRGPQPVTLDFCYPCTSVWFDPRKYEVLKTIYGTEKRAAHILEQKWKWALVLLGMPVERQDVPTLSRPWVTWIVAAFTTLVSVLAFLFLPALQFALCMIPADALRMGGLTLLTTFLVHGGWVHLGGNMYFLIAFGRRVEDSLGRKRYLLLLLLATLAGSLLHISIDPQSTRPTVGASGGIAGVIGFYGFQFARTRLLVRGQIIPFLMYPLRGWSALLAWILLQLVGVWAQIQGFSNVSAMAHLGGLAVGIAFWAKWRNRLPAESA